MPLPIYAALCHRADTLSTASASLSYASPPQSTQRIVRRRYAMPSLPAMDRDASLFPAGYLCGL